MTRHGARHREYSGEQARSLLPAWSLQSEAEVKECGT